MQNLLIAFTGEKTRARMVEIMEAAGISVTAACSSGTEVLSYCAEGSGLILCGYRLYDMTAGELAEQLPENYILLLLADQAQLDLSGPAVVHKLAAPARQSELTGAVEALLNREIRPSLPPKRSDEDRRIIQEAKQLLMERNAMTESQAHRFLQKRSMDAGAPMIQTAKRVLSGELIDI